MMNKRGKNITHIPKTEIGDENIKCEKEVKYLVLIFDTNYLYFLKKKSIKYFIN